MKPREKKLCVSICLSQLFEAVLDEKSGGKEGMEKFTGLIKSSDPIEEAEQKEFFLTQKANNDRNYKNEWLKFRKESYCYKSSLEKLDNEGNWQPTAGIITKDFKSTSREIKLRQGNFYSLSLLKINQKKERREKAAKKKVDIAVSTSFLKTSAKIIHNEVITVPEQVKRTSKREKVDAGIQTDEENCTIARVTVESKFHEERLSFYRYCAECSMRTRIINSIKSNKKSFLATKSVKRTNLSLRNHKSTHMDLEKRLNVKGYARDLVKHQKSKLLILRDVPDQDKKLEELFYHKKFIGNSLKNEIQIKKSQILEKGIIMKSRMICPRISSQMKISQQKKDIKVLKRSKISHSINQFVENYTSNMSEKNANIFCSPMNVPWEMFPSETEGNILDKSLNLFRANCCPRSDMYSFRMETECEIFPRISSGKTDSKLEHISECDNLEITTFEKPIKQSDEEKIVIKITEKKVEESFQVEENNRKCNNLESAKLEQITENPNKEEIIVEIMGKKTEILFQIVEETDRKCNDLETTNFDQSVENLDEKKISVELIKKMSNELLKDEEIICEFNKKEDETFNKPTKQMEDKNISMEIMKNKMEELIQVQETNTDCNNPDTEPAEALNKDEIPIEIMKKDTEEFINVEKNNFICHNLKNETFKEATKLVNEEKIPMEIIKKKMEVLFNVEETNNECNFESATFVQSAKNLDEKKIEMELTKRISEKLIKIENINSEDNIYLRQMIVETLGPQIIEEVKRIAMRQELSNTDKDNLEENPIRKKASSKAFIIEWEVEIELSNHNRKNQWRRLMKNKSSPAKLEIAKKISKTFVIFPPSTSRFYVNSDSTSQHSIENESEENYMKDEKISKLYPLNVTKHLFMTTKERLQEIGR